MKDQLEITVYCKHQIKCFLHMKCTYPKRSLFRGGLNQWGRSNRPRPRPGIVKSLNAPLGVVIVNPLTGLCQENWPLSYVSLVRATYCTIGSGQYTLLSGRPLQTGQVLFELKFTTGIECFAKITSQISNLESKFHLNINKAGTVYLAIFKLKYLYRKMYMHTTWILS